MDGGVLEVWTIHIYLSMSFVQMEMQVTDGFRRNLWSPPKKNLSANQRNSILYDNELKRRECSEPVVRVLAIAARWAAVAVWFVAVLVRVLLLVHVVMVLSALLRTRWTAVSTGLMRALVVVVFIWGHQVAPLVGCGVVSCVVGMPRPLALLVLRYRENSIKTYLPVFNTQELHTFLLGNVQFFQLHTYNQSLCHFCEVVI